MVEHVALISTARAETSQKGQQNPRRMQDRSFATLVQSYFEYIQQIFIQNAIKSVHKYPLGLVPHRLFYVIQH